MEQRKSRLEADNEKSAVKKYALETIGNLLDMVDDKAEEEKILRSFYIHYSPGSPREEGK